MSYNPKYQFSFYDLLGAKCTVQLAFNNYLGAVNTLVGGVSPVIISHSGDDSNPFDPIRASKCNLAIKIDANCGLLISDLQDIDDTTILANITISTGKSFVGWVTPIRRLEISL